MGLRKEDLGEKYTYNNYKYWDDSEDWEIIGGKAYNMAPSPITKHQKIGTKILGEFISYLKGKTCNVFYELDVVLSDEDIVTPDIFVVCDKEKIKEKNVQGAPDLVVEILSPSTAKKDRSIKMELYKKYGVKEYWIVDPYNLIIEIYFFEKDDRSIYGYNKNLDDNFIEIDLFDKNLKLDVNYIFKE